ncbi:MAG: TonB family protein [Chthoniobacterales bacterium]
MKFAWFTPALAAAALSLASAEELSLTRENVAGQYALGGGPNQVRLTLYSEGAFTMTSPASLGDGQQATGEWHVTESRVSLWSKKGKRVFRWGMEAFPHNGSFDLVPEELLTSYKESPSNIGTAYRKFAGVEAAPSRSMSSVVTNSAMNTAAAAPLQTTSPRVSTPTTNLQVSKGAPQAVPAKQIRPESAAPSRAADIAAPQAVRSSEPSRSQPAVSTMFYYTPAPTEIPDSTGLSDAGLARLSIDTKGNVTAVKILRSTGKPRFDAEATDTLLRWRARPGPQRETDVPLTSVLSGTRGPVRIPTTSGSLSIG